MVFSNPLPLTEYPGSESTFVNLLKSDLSFQLEKCLLLLLTSLLKTSILLMDERLPAVHLELLEMCRERVELVMLLPRNLLCHRLQNSCLSCSSSDFVLLDCSIIRSDLLLPSAITLLLLKRRARSKGLLTVVKL